MSNQHNNLNVTVWNTWNMLNLTQIF